MGVQLGFNRWADDGLKFWHDSNSAQRESQIRDIPAGAVMNFLGDSQENERVWKRRFEWIQFQGDTFWSQVKLTLNHHLCPLNMFSGIDFTLLRRSSSVMTQNQNIDDDSWQLWIRVSRTFSYHPPILHYLSHRCNPGAAFLSSGHRTIAVLCALMLDGLHLLLWVRLFFHLIDGWRIDTYIVFR